MLPKLVFDRDVLYSKFLFASSFSSEATLWIKNDICEIVIANEIFVKVLIPFTESVNIEKDTIQSFNIPVRNLYKQSLSNNKTKLVSIIFLSHNEVKIESSTIHDVVIPKNLVYNESVSCYKIADSDDEDVYNEQNVYTLKQGNYTSAIDSSQRYKTDNIVSEFYRINMYEYRNVIGNFVIDFFSLNSFIKNLINIKPNNILFKVENDMFYFKCQGVDPIETSIFSKVLDFNKKIDFESVLSFKSFKKLNSLSKIGKGEGKNKQKVFDNILFQIIFNEYNEPYGISISTNLPEYFEDYFIFIPFIRNEII